MEWLEIVVLILLLTSLAAAISLLLALRRTTHDEYKWRSYGSGDFFGPYDYEFRGRGTGIANDVISEAESRYEIRLSPAARAMLAIPLIEVDRQEGVNWDQARDSVFSVVSDLRERTQRRRYDSVSVIAAFTRTFCNIPPFCRPSEPY